MVAAGLENEFNPSDSENNYLKLIIMYVPMIISANLRIHCNKKMGNRMYLCVTVILEMLQDSHQISSNRLWSGKMT